MNTLKHKYKILFEPGSIYPTQTPVELDLACSTYNQNSIEIVICEIQETNFKTGELLFSSNGLSLKNKYENVKEYNILNSIDDKRCIIKLNQPGNPGDNRIKVKFNINLKKELTITVVDLKNNSILYMDLPIANVQ